MTVLTEMADILRGVGLSVREEPGLDKGTGTMIPWQDFGRSSNQVYSPGYPNHIMEHHTASNATPESDVAYCNVGSDIRPLTNLLIDRGGVVHVCAGRPTNTNGSGAMTWGASLDGGSMNRSAIGIEIANTGVGEAYPTIQQQAVMGATIALARAYNIAPNNVRAHFEWAPDRKIDPRGPSSWTDGHNVMWDMSRFRADVATGLGSPHPGGEEVAALTTPIRWISGQRMTKDVPFVPELPASVGNPSQVLINLTVTSAASPGFLVSYTGNRPDTSNINFQTGESIANTALVKVGADRKIVFIANEDCTLIVDIQAT
jgi:hypothetical protein